MSSQSGASNYERGDSWAASRLGRTGSLLYLACWRSLVKTLRRRLCRVRQGRFIQRCNASRRAGPRRGTEMARKGLVFKRSNVPISMGDPNTEEAEMSECWFCCDCRSISYEPVNRPELMDPSVPGSWENRWCCESCHSQDLVEVNAVETYDLLTSVQARLRTLAVSEDGFKPPMYRQIKQLCRQTEAAILMFEQLHDL